MDKKNILAIDPATTSGWAQGESAGLIVLKGDWGHKLHTFEKLIIGLINRDTKLIAYELPTGRFHNALVSHSKLAGILEKVAYEHDLGIKGYTATAIKKHATGSGRAKKRHMVLMAWKRYGYDGEDDNIADALHLLDFAVGKEK